MLMIGNLWRELWGTSKPVPAVKKAPLFDEDLAVLSLNNILFVVIYIWKKHRSNSLCHCHQVLDSDTRMFSRH